MDDISLTCDKTMKLHLVSCYMFTVNFNGTHYILGKYVHLMSKHTDSRKNKEGYLHVFWMRCFYTHLQSTTRCTFLLDSICYAIILR